MAPRLCYLILSLMACSLIDDTNDVKMFTFQVELRAVGVFRFFYNYIDNFHVSFRWSFSENRAHEKEENKIAQPSRHFHVLCLSNIALEQSARHLGFALSLKAQSGVIVTTCDFKMESFF